MMLNETGVLYYKTLKFNPRSKITVDESCGKYSTVHNAIPTVDTRVENKQN